VAAVGSGLADLAVGATLYMIPTMIIKGAMGYVVCRLAKRYFIACLIGGMIMVSGYFVVEIPMFGMLYAAASLPFNAIQFVANLIAAIMLKDTALRIKQK
jgi:uncharacterized membrane protein